MSEKVQQVHSMNNECSEISIVRTVEVTMERKELGRDVLETGMVSRRSAGL